MKSGLLEIDERARVEGGAALLLLPGDPLEVHVQIKRTTDGGAPLGVGGDGALCIPAPGRSTPRPGASLDFAPPLFCVSTSRADEGVRGAASNRAGPER